MPEIKYTDCRVTILNDEETSYKDTYKAATPGRLRGLQDGDALVRDTIERLNGWVATQQDLCNREDLQLLGRHLYYLLLDEDLRKQFEETYEGFKKAAGENQRLRLILEF